MSSQARLGDVVPPPFAPEGRHEEAQKNGPQKAHQAQKCFKGQFVPVCGEIYSTVTDFARLRGWSTSQPRRTAM